MLKHLLSALKKKPQPALPPSAPADPRVAKVVAAHHAFQAQYAALEQPARAADAPLQTMMDFAQACFELELDSECEDALKRVLARDPDNPQAHYALALLISNFARFAEAESHLRQALARAPNDINVRFAMTMNLLARNRYAEGHRMFRVRMEGPSHPAPHIAALPAWAGEPLAGKTLVLWSDWGGLGDDIAYGRFVRGIRATCHPARLIVAVPRPLRRFFAVQSYVDEVVDLADEVQADLQCGLIESANILGITFETLPSWPSVFEVPAPDLQYWRTQLRHEPRLKVGLAWTTTSVPPIDLGRVGRADKHLPDTALALLCGVPGMVFVSLQKGAHIAKAADLLPGAAVIDDTDDLHDFIDTAALMRQLDLIVTIDTGVAHLAGALGVPTLVLLRKGRGYFWPEARSDTPWYPSVRMVVQEQVRDWESVLLRTRAVLQRRAAGVPWPECFDRT